MKDYYAILGLRPDCDSADIKAAYRQLVLLHHPDHNPGDTTATERFLDIQAAYETLGDEELRLDYDRAYVQAFPGYELEEEDRYWEHNPPASMPIVRDDGSTTLLRMLMVLILPLVGGGFVMYFTGNVTWAALAAAAGLVMAIWLGSWMRDG